MVTRAFLLGCEGPSKLYTQLSASYLCGRTSKAFWYERTSWSLSAQERLARFGKLRACRLVTDKGTRRLKGTAFAEYERREDAERAAAACAQARRGVPSPQRPPLPLHVAMLPSSPHAQAAGLFSSVRLIAADVYKLY